MSYPFFRHRRTIYWNEDFAIVQNGHARIERLAQRVAAENPGPIEWTEKHPSFLTSGQTGSQHDLKPGDCPHAWRLDA